MKKIIINQKVSLGVAKLSMPELRQKWAEYWGIQPHWRIGRQMLEKSLTFKQREARGEGMTPEQIKRLDNLVAQYKRDPKSFDQGPGGLKPGTKLVRAHEGQKHVVTVKSGGFEYRNQDYSSLSEVAFVITGTHWNGWIFFGVKRRPRSYL